VSDEDVTAPLGDMHLVVSEADDFSDSQSRIEHEADDGLVSDIVAYLDLFHESSRFLVGESFRREALRREGFNPLDGIFLDVFEFDGHLEKEPERGELAIDRSDGSPDPLQGFPKVDDILSNDPSECETFPVFSFVPPHELADIEKQGSFRMIRVVPLHERLEGLHDLRRGFLVVFRYDLRKFGIAVIIHNFYDRIFHGKFIKKYDW
jgi:hypothetical protein